MPTARKKVPNPLQKQIQYIVEALARHGYKRSVGTIKAWVREGMDPYDSQSVIQWLDWKNLRSRNRPNQERPARRYRPPC